MIDAPLAISMVGNVILVLMLIMCERWGRRGWRCADENHNRYQGMVAMFNTTNEERVEMLRQRDGENKRYNDLYNAIAKVLDDIDKQNKEED